MNNPADGLEERTAELNEQHEAAMQDIELTELEADEPTFFSLFCELGLRVELHDALAAGDADSVREIEEQIREIKGET